MEILTNIRRCADCKDHKSWSYSFELFPFELLGKTVHVSPVSALFKELAQHPPHKRFHT